MEGLGQQARKSPQRHRGGAWRKSTHLVQTQPRNLIGILSGRVRLRKSGKLRFSGILVAVCHFFLKLLSPNWGYFYITFEKLTRVPYNRTNDKTL